jgi:hypothetical protein
VSNYVYTGKKAPSLGAFPGLTTGAANATLLQRADLHKFTIKQQVQATSPAQRRAALQRFRPQAIAEFQKQGLGNFVTVTTTGELRLLTPFGALDDIARACLQMPLPSLSLDVTTGKFTTTSTQVGTQMVDAIPFLSAADKARLKNAPFSFVAGIFDPMIDFVGSVLEDVMDAGMSPAQQSAKTAKDTGELGKGGYVYDLTTFPFSLAVVPLQALGIKIPNLKAVNIALEQPGDELFEPVSRRQIKTLRTVLAFFVLFFKKWLELHGRFLAKIRDMAFPEDDTKLHRIDEAGDGTSMAQPRVLERLPSDALGPFSKSVPSSAPTAAENSANRLVWVIPQDNRKNQKRSFVTLSAQGFAARKQALARDFDAKYKAFEKDFNFWHPDYAARCGWLVNVEKKSEREAHDIAAREYELPQKFGALSRGKFAITAGPTLGGGLGGLGNRHSLTGTVAGLSGIGALRDLFENYQHLGVPPDPASTTVELGAAEAAGLSEGAIIAIAICSVVGFGLGVAGAVVLGIVAMDKGFEPDVKVGADKDGNLSFEFSADKVPSGSPPSAPPSGSPPSAPPSREPPSREPPSGGAGTQSESASGGFPVVPVALAAGVALLLLSRR